MTSAPKPPWKKENNKDIFNLVDSSWLFFDSILRITNYYELITNNEIGSTKNSNGR